jgi:hypothetical protein
VSLNWRGIGFVVPLVVIVASAVGCSSGQTPRADGATDRHDSGGDARADAGAQDVVQEARGGQDARDGSDAGHGVGDASGDAADGAVDAWTADVVVPDAIADGSGAADGRADRVDAPLDQAMADAINDSAGAADGPADAPVEMGRPYVERDCSNQDACACASNESCSFTCPGGGCTVTCAAGSDCTVVCASPFGCSVSCGNDAQCILACNLGICWHFSGPARNMACDPGGTGCL